MSGGAFSARIHGVVIYYRLYTQPGRQVVVAEKPGGGTRRNILIIYSPDDSWPDKETVKRFTKVVERRGVMGDVQLVDGRWKLTVYEDKWHRRRKQEAPPVS